MNKGIKVFFISNSLFFLIGNGYTKTREEVISDANNYLVLNWQVRDDNILDAKHCDENVSTATYSGKMVPGGNGIDDRAEYLYEEGDKLKCRYSRSQWPFFVGDNVSGEAYAWGLWDSVNEFSGKINSGEKWIAGRREEDLLPAGYRGFGGIDCSGFVSRVWGLGGYYYSGKLPSFSIMINKDKIKAGDILNKVGVHSIIFKEWISTENMTAKVIHATGWSIKNPTHMRRVVMDELQMAQKEDGNIYIYWPTTKKEEPYDNWHLYNFYSAFPQFEWSGSSMNVVKLI